VTEPDQVEINAKDIESLAGKLAAFGAALNAEEQAILTRMLESAAGAGSEVSGYGASTAFGSALGADLAAGIGFPGTGAEAKKSSGLFLACCTGKHFPMASITH
jgi:hypothetical protein